MPELAHKKTAFPINNIVSRARTCPQKDGWHGRSTLLPWWPLLQTSGLESSFSTSIPKTGYRVSSTTQALDKHFQTFKAWTFVPAIFWGLIICVVKMWSDRYKSSRKDAQYQYYFCNITLEPLRHHTKRVSDTRRQNCPKPPETFKRKLFYGGWKNH